MTAYLAKSAIVLALLLAIYHLFLEKEKMHTFKRFYLLGALTVSMLLPFLIIPVYVEVYQPAFYEEMTTQVTFMPVQQQTVSTKPAPNPASYFPFVAWILYMVITGAFALRFALNLRRFYNDRLANITIQFNESVLVIMDKPTTPYTFLNHIYISRDEYESRFTAPELLTHELAHVQQKHSVDILFIEILKTVFWFNPLFYLYKKAIQLNHEFLADEAVINQHLNITNYRKLLLDKATPITAHVLASSINFSLTKKRFTMMTKTTSKCRSLLLKIAVLPVIAGITYAVTTETVAKQMPASQDAETHLTPADSITYKKKRDAYYSGVKVVIDDQANNVYINTPFEELTEKQKARYYFSVPDGYPITYLSEKNYNKLQDKKGYYVEIDGLPIDNSELKNHSTEEFVYHTVIIKARESLTKERPQIFEYYLYTLPYYNEHFKNKELTHFPDTIYKMKIVKEYKDGKVVAAAKPKIFSNVKAAMKYLENKKTYNYTDVDKMPQYPGGLDKFISKVKQNFKAPASANPSISLYYLTVIIGENGSLNYVTVINTDDDATVTEFVRVLKMSDTWKPGLLNGKPVATSYTIPITLN